jgi:hypothetical protein
MSDEPMHPMVQLRFTRSHPPYRTGDVAAFPLGAAQQIVAQRHAVAIAGIGPAPPNPTGEAPTNQRAVPARVTK